MISTVKEKVRAIEALTFYGINLNINGKGLGDCPHCGGKNKLRVSDELIYCYKCSYRGDFLNLITEIKGCSLREVLVKLATQFNITQQYTYKLSLMQDIWEQWLKKTNYRESKSYLEKRGLYNVEHCTYSPLSISPQELEKVGILINNKEVFNNRVIFPIRDSKGTIVHFQGRSLNPDDNLRWLSTKGEPAIHKYLFNSHNFIDNTPVFVCEGIPDTLSLYSLGFNTVGTLGVGMKLTQHYTQLKNAKSITFCYDNDKYDNTNPKLEGKYKSWSSTLPKIVELSEALPNTPMYVLIPPDRDSIKDINDWTLNVEFDRQRWINEARCIRISLEDFMLSQEQDRSELLTFLLRRKAKQELLKLENTAREKHNEYFWQYFY